MPGSGGSNAGAARLSLVIRSRAMEHRDSHWRVTYALSRPRATAAATPVGAYPPPRSQHRSTRVPVGWEKGSEGPRKRRDARTPGRCCCTAGSGSGGNVFGGSGIIPIISSGRQSVCRLSALGRDDLSGRAKSLCSGTVLPRGSKPFIISPPLPRENPEWPSGIFKGLPAACNWPGSTAQELAVGRWGHSGAALLLMGGPALP